AARLVTEAMEKVKNMVSQVAKATSEQSKGANLITKATEKVRDVANRVKLATEEQQMSARFISESMDQISEKSHQIAKAINEQRAGSNQIFISIEKIKDIPRNNMDFIADIDDSLKTLLKTSDTIDRQMERLKIPEEVILAARGASVFESAGKTNRTT
ncbi:MAG TPA: hypothetical protein VK435_08130, partial [Thermodesulfovibrionales bacterium]|nr:hypothetical protein [Thermodesulfovibrionales bacterium]